MAQDSAVALISTADAKTYLKITGSTDDTILEDLIDQISVLCNSYCGRKLLSRTYTEYYDGNGLSELILKHYPISSVTTLHIADDNRTFTATFAVTVNDDVIIRKDSGILRLWNNESTFIKGNANIKVVYVAGWTTSTLPHDLQLAVRKWVAYEYMKYNTRRHGIQSQTVGEMTTTFIDRDIPLEVKAILDQYRTRYDIPDFAFSDAEA